MKKTSFSVLLTLAMIIGLCACGQKDTALTWQEQYDLGIRYLSEGNYEEAIIAFTAAIEIDPKQADAYIGLADIYIARGDTAKAAEILEQAIDAIGENDALREYLEALTDSGDETPPEPEGLAAPEDTTPASAQGGGVAFSGAGHDLTLSLTWPGLPHQVYAEGQDSFAAVFTMSVSDGNETFRVWTNLVEGTTGMLTVPDGSPWETNFSVAVRDPEDPTDVYWTNTNTPATVSRSGDTLIWNVQLPEGAFLVNDIQYVGYFLYYDLTEEGGEGYGTAAYSTMGGNLTHVSDDILESLGYVISEEEADRYKN